MSRAAVNFILDTLMLMIFIAQLGAMCIVHLIFPAGSRATGWSLWGYDYDFWNALSFGITVVFTFAVLLHMILHWSWVCTFLSVRMARRRGETPQKPDDGIQTIYGVGTLIGILLTLGAVLAVAKVVVREPTATPKDKSTPTALIEHANYDDYS